MAVESSRTFALTSVFFIALAGLVSLLNLALVVIAGALLSPPDFGLFASCVAALTLGVIASGAYQMIVTRNVASGYWNRIDHEWRSQTLRILKFSAIAALPVVILSGELGRAFGSGRAEILVLYLALVGSVFGSLASGFTSGLRLLKAQGVILLASTVLKVAIAACLMALGWAAVGGVAGYLFGFILLYAVSRRMVRGRTLSPSEVPGSEKHSLLPAAVHLLLSAPFAIDQILVQLWHRDLSGEYGAVGTVAKSIYFLCGPVIMVLYPYLVSSRESPGQQRRYLLIGVSLAGALGGGVLVVLMSAPSFVMGLLFSKYTPAAAVLPIQGTGIYFFLLSSVIALYLLALERRGVLIPLCLTLCMQSAVFFVIPSDLLFVSLGQTAVYSLQLIALMAIALREFLRRAA